jgi:hypothetical protein
LRGNTAFMHLLNRKGSRNDITKLFQEGWTPCVTGQTEFNIEHARWLSKGAKSETLSIFDIPTTSDMYVRSEVSIDDSLKVGGINLLVPGQSKWLNQRTVAKVGLYEITSTMEEWCDEKMRRLILAREEVKRPLARYEILPIFQEDREWINDDTTLIASVIESTKDLSRGAQVALVSKDKRLANQMCRQAGVTVILIDPTCLPRVYPAKTWNSNTTLSRKEVFEAYPDSFKKSGKLREPVEVCIDTGSLMSALSGMTTETDVRGVKRFYTLKPVASGHMDGGKRWEEYTKTTIFGSSRLCISVIDSKSKDLYQRNRNPFGRDEASRSMHSWNREDSLQVKQGITHRKRGGRTL